MGEDHSSRTKISGRFDRFGNIIDGNKKAPAFWPEAIQLAEKMAQKTDALRVDFLVKQDGGKTKLLLNELEIWPESDWSSKRKTLEKELNNGYRHMCKPRTT